jgi:geranylgeranyl transferase type-2 subunit alpha
LLVKFPKCYWIWNHRLWLLEQARTRLQTSIAHEFWNEELGLATKMLARDSRNFHGWGYRRGIIEGLQGIATAATASEENASGLGNQEGSTSMVQSEFDYTTRMIKVNLSNFSAWHARSKLIPRLLDEKGANEEVRRKMLDDGL